MARQLVRYGGYLSAADLVNLGLLNVDYIIVGHVLGPVALGYYSLAYRICFMPYLSIAVVVNGAVFPYYCRLAVAGSDRPDVGRHDVPHHRAEHALVRRPRAVRQRYHAARPKWIPATGALRFLACTDSFSR